MRIYPTYLSLALKAFLSLKQKPKAYVSSNIKFSGDSALLLPLVSAKLVSKDKPSLSVKNQSCCFASPEVMVPLR